MIKEAIDAFRALADEAAAPKRMAVPDASKIYYIVNGEVEEIPTPPPPREHTAGSLNDLIKLANRFGEDGRSPVVWVGTNRVVLVIDDADYRQNRVKFPLDHGKVFCKLTELAGNTPWYEPKPFLRLLKIELTGSWDDMSLINAVSKVKFDNTTTTAAEMTKTRESMGREINATIASDKEIPDFVTLSVPVYSTTEERRLYPLRCTVEVDPFAGKFRLMPVPDEISRVQQLASDSILYRLEEGLTSGIPFYLGSE